MTTRWSMILITISLLAGLALPGIADEISFADLLSGKVAPLSITMKELTVGWMQLSVAGQESSQMDFFSTMIMSQAKMAIAPAYTFTRGQVVTVQGQSYLIVYRMPVNYQALAGLRMEDPFSGRGLTVPQPEVTPETKLAMTLLNTKQIGSLKEMIPADPASCYAKGDKPASLPLPGSPIDDARTRARRTKATSDLRQLALMAQMYAQEHAETMPPIVGQRDIAVILQAQTALLTSPVTNQPYRYNYAMSGKGLGQIRNPTDTVLFYDQADETGMRVVAFVDGHVAPVDAKEWNRLINAGNFE